MAELLKAGLIGCGDYLRWEIDDLNNNRYVKVKSTFDLESSKSKRIAEKIGAKAVDTADQIYDDPEIKIVLIFTPPYERKDLFRMAVLKGKHIITTKPFGSNLNDAEELYDMVKNRVNCAVFYGRTGNANVEMIKKILDSGEIGHLALYKEDWLHHYPVWNDWATDPEKNGGPFMDAMVHNLNKARYLIGSTVQNVTYYSDNFAQSLKCNDTEFMKLDFHNGAASYLFITWAANLEVFDPTGNDRVHYGIQQLITNEGWYITEEEIDDKQVIKAVKEKEIKTWEVDPLPYTKYDLFSINLQEGKPQPADVSDAIIDMQIMQAATKQKSVPV
jgi:predicted dehydrogenase